MGVSVGRAVAAEGGREAAGNRNFPDHVSRSMSPVGHSLVGLAIGIVATDARMPVRRRVGALAVFVAAANLPDWPLPYWGHSAYHISHSLPVAFGVIALIAGIVKACRPFSSRSLLPALAAAWLSHLLLDSLYGHGKGIGVGWPFLDYRLRFPVPWLQTIDLQQSLVSHHNLSVYVVSSPHLGRLCFSPSASQSGGRVVHQPTHRPGTPKAIKKPGKANAFPGSRHVVF